jgi:hypothetical protein
MAAPAAGGALPGAPIVRRASPPGACAAVARRGEARERSGAPLCGAWPMRLGAGAPPAHRGRALFADCLVRQRWKMLLGPFINTHRFYGPGRRLWRSGGCTRTAERWQCGTAAPSQPHEAGKSRRAYTGTGARLARARWLTGRHRRHPPPRRPRCPLAWPLRRHGPQVSHAAERTHDTRSKYFLELTFRPGSSMRGREQQLDAATLCCRKHACGRRDRAATQRRAVGRRGLVRAEAAVAGVAAGVRRRAAVGRVADHQRCAWTARPTINEQWLCHTKALCTLAAPGQQQASPCGLERSHLDPLHCTPLRTYAAPPQHQRQPADRRAPAPVPTDAQRGRQGRPAL